jgi:hypothetical protein
MNDDKLFFSDKQSLVKGSTGDIDSTNVIDFAAVKPDPGMGRSVFLNIVVTTAVAGGTINFVLKDSADNSTYAAVYETGAIAAASLTAGKKVIRMALPEGVRRYLKMVYTVGTSATTAGAGSAWLDIN